MKLQKLHWAGQSLEFYNCSRLKIPPPLVLVALPNLHLCFRLIRRHYFVLVLNPIPHVCNPYISPAWACIFIFNHSHPTDPYTTSLIIRGTTQSGYILYVAVGAFLSVLFFFLTLLPDTALIMTILQNDRFHSMSVKSLIFLPFRCFCHFSPTHNGEKFGVQHIRSRSWGSSWQPLWLMASLS